MNATADKKPTLLEMFAEAAGIGDGEALWQRLMQSAKFDCPPELETQCRVFFFAGATLFWLEALEIPPGRNHDLELLLIGERVRRSLAAATEKPKR